MEVRPATSTVDGNTYSIYQYSPPATDESKDPGTSWGAGTIGGYYCGSAAASYCYPNSGGRHFGGANVAYADGHVKFQKAKTPGFFFVNTGTPSNITELSKEAINLGVPISTNHNNAFPGYFANDKSKGSHGVSRRWRFVNNVDAVWLRSA